MEGQSGKGLDIFFKIFFLFFCFFGGAVGLMTMEVYIDRHIVFSPVSLFAPLKQEFFFY